MNGLVRIRKPPAKQLCELLLRDCALGSAHRGMFTPRSWIGYPGGLGSASIYVVSIHHRLLDPMRQFRGHVATSLLHLYATPRCGGALRRPAGPSLFSLAVLSLHAVDPTRWSTVSFRCTRAAMPGFLELATSRQPQYPPLPAIPDGAYYFGAASFSYVAACMFA